MPSKIELRCFGKRLPQTGIVGSVAARRSRAVSERTRNVAQLRCSYGECHSREIIAIETP